MHRCYRSDVIIVENLCNKGSRTARAPIFWECIPADLGARFNLNATPCAGNLSNILGCGLAHIAQVAIPNIKPKV
jgi:hypothetical protein